MITIIDKKKCVGCANCSIVCPQKCIQMEMDNMGFYYPVTDSNNCINCHLCEKVCPVVRTTSIAKKNTPLVYAVKSKNMKARMNSSSGGFFYELAKCIYSLKGHVWGAAYVERKVMHIDTDSLSQIELLQKSKYAQSDLGYCFKEIEKQLKSGLYVLFTGTPCQISALISFLRKEYLNLITMEVFCHGIPSPMVFRRYLDEIDAKGMDFRSKSNSWVNYDVKIQYQDGHTSVEQAKKNIFMQGFLGNLYLRPSCFDCPSKYDKSIADFTVGDYWGINNVLPDFSDDKGVSAVLINTQKAIPLWHKIKENMEFASSVLDDVVKFNLNLVESASLNKGYDYFWKIQEKKTIANSTLKAVAANNSLKKIVKKNLLFLYNLVWYVYLKLKDSFYLLKDKLYCYRHNPPVIIDILSTLEYIKENKCSVSRYGDGELKFVVGGETSFQQKSPELGKRLKEILYSNIPNHIVCIPQWFDNLEQYKDPTWGRLHNAYWRKKWYKNIDFNKIYYDSMISRCYMPYKDKERSVKSFGLWKEIWSERDILIMEGEKTRLGVGNDLFDNVKSIKRILCPNRNAYRLYDSLLQEAYKYDKSYLILIAIGPTATVLAADLAIAGYQAIDCGHIDVEYEWFLKKAIKRIPVSNKYVNEAGYSGKYVWELNDMKYNKEIVCHLE